MKSFGYKHWTLEEIPRCFYVGKGVEGRAQCAIRRSRKWQTVARRYGFRVEVCLGPVSDAEAIAWEINNIAAEDTFTTSFTTEGGKNIRCNFTRGGDGALGYRHTVQHKMHIAQVLRGNHHTLGRKRSSSERYAIAIKQQLLTRADVEQIQCLDENGVHYIELMTQFNCSYPVLRRAIRGVYRALQ
jgi:hypothetical protein